MRNYFTYKKVKKKSFKKTFFAGFDFASQDFDCTHPTPVGWIFFYNLRPLSVKSTWTTEAFQSVKLLEKPLKPAHFSAATLHHFDHISHIRTLQKRPCGSKRPPLFCIVEMVYLRRFQGVFSVTANIQPEPLGSPSENAFTIGWFLVVQEEGFFFLFLFLNNIKGWIVCCLGEL